MPNKKKLPNIKKEISDFLLSEEGRISKKSIVKLGISLAILTVMLQPDAANAVDHTSHDSMLYSSGTGGHSSNTAHSNHSNHSSHGSGGWC